MQDSSDITAPVSQSIAQTIIYKILSRIQYGQIILVENNDLKIFYGVKDASQHKVTVRVHNKNLFHQLMLTGTNGAADSYIAGDWEVDDLTVLIEIILLNTAIFKGLDNAFSLLLNAGANFFNALRKNNVVKAKQNILAHYDLGNDFFKLFLDKNKMYSCAIYSATDKTLEAAALHKLDVIAMQMALKPDEHILEIGSGWGGFAIHAAQHYGCKVTTTTISDLQYAHVKNEISRLGLQNQITLLNKDYRELQGQYDKVVSIEMIEAVGYQFFPRFFQQCNALIKPGGLLFLQAITINEMAYAKAKKEVDFIKRIIFPGGCLPSIGVIHASIAKFTQLQLLHWRDIGEHYARTLMDWRARFYLHIDQIKQQGFDDKFLRAWDFYFCYCAAGFRQRYISTIHGMWRKQQ